MKKDVQKGPLLYEGKGKKVYQVLGEEGQVILYFKDDLTAAQARKKDSFSGKGQVCKNISSLIFQHLKKQDIPVHWIEDLGPQESLCFKTQILPLEVVVRNRLAGSTSKRLGFEEGHPIKEPLLEFYYKKDELDDPFLSEEQIIKLEFIPNPSLLSEVKSKAFLINKTLRPFFSKAHLELIDFKMEFGLFQNKLLLSDDISPDSSRVWDKETGYRFDKDRFRRGWGKVEEGYRAIEEKLYSTWKGKF